MTNFWDTRFSEPGYAYGTTPNDFLVSIANEIPHGRVLCLAEGEGRNAVYLAEQGYEVTAVDSSSVGLVKAQELAAQHKVTIKTERADLSEFEIAPDYWHGIVSIFAHIPPQVRCRIHHDAVKGLIPGGVFVLEAYTPRQLEFGTGGPQDAGLLMSLAMLQEELQGLALPIAQEVKRYIHEGRYHKGLSSVVQVVGVKK